MKNLVDSTSSFIGLELHEYIINYIIILGSIPYFTYILFQKKTKQYDTNLSIVFVLSAVLLLFHPLKNMQKLKLLLHTAIFIGYLGINFSNNLLMMLYGIFYGFTIMMIWEWNGGCTLGSADPTGEGGKGIMGNIIGTLTLLTVIYNTFRIGKKISKGF